MAIERVKIRARVSVGSQSIETPFVLSFNVRKSRGQISTFDCSLKVTSTTGSNLVGGPIEISAGEGSPTTTIFTGIVRKVTISPCFDDPEYVIMNLSGADVFSLLQNKKYTRRCVGSKTSWVTINSVSRKGLKSGKFKYKKEPVLIVTESELKDSASTTYATKLTGNSVLDGALAAPQHQSKNASLIATPMVEGSTS